ncbi:MaoC family dehydratase [Methylobacterium oryzihabitans]|uniref:MaoC family dehydratase n=1 Tax=Methylobacterium oryzihabitans TaxID=2499852 RepID=A0A437NWV5_9HYPH|nr:MaoC family dehydratase [Methylobacterium oryzihabitans]RVU14411.1 MaoC family dehydratase [Methylobacterium oryzihabitans]
MIRIHFEDLVPGLVLPCGPITVTRDEIVAFARAYDPQPFHLDEAAARGSFVGRLIASGWHSCALGMRLIARDFILQASSMGSPGIDAVHWLRPVLPGDALTLTMTIAEARPSASKPDRGLVRVTAAMANGGGETVMTQEFWVMFGRRGAAPLPARTLPPREPGPPTFASEAGFPAGGYDSLAVGATYDLGGYHFGRDEVLAFARAFDPQPFHVDEAAARQSHFGGLCASGWHTAAGFMNRLVAARDLGRRQAEARGGPVAAGGPSPGFRNLKWLRPVYAGDTIRFAITLTDKRPSASRPGWGLVHHAASGRDQHGDEVFRFDGAWFAPRE